MRKLVLFFVAVVVVGTLVFSGCTTSTPAPAPTSAPAPAPTSPEVKTITLKWSLNEAESDPRYVKVLGPYFKDEIEKRTNGRVKLVTYFANGLVPSKDSYQGVRDGVCDISDQPSPYLPAGAFPITDVFGQSLPSQISERPSRIFYELYKALPEFQAEYNDVHLIMQYSPFDYFKVLTTAKPVRTMEDMKGLKLWALGKASADKTKAVGATPVSIPAADMYMSLKTGVLDGITGSANNLIIQKLNEIVKYLTDVNLNYGMSWMAMNKAKWNSLPPDIQKIITDVAEVCVDQADNYAKSDAKIGIDTSREKYGLQVITLSPEEYARWDKACQPVREQWLAEKTAAKLPAQKALDLFDQLLKKYAK